MASFKDIGAYQVTAADIGAYEAEDAGEPAPAGGQVINVMFSKLAVPAMWAMQGTNNRREFMKNTSLAMIGIT